MELAGLSPVEVNYPECRENVHSLLAHRPSGVEAQAAKAEPLKSSCLRHALCCRYGLLLAWALPAIWRENCHFRSVTMVADRVAPNASI